MRRRRSGVSDDSVFLALNDTQKRFAIPDELLEDLVRGTTMDLEPRAQAEAELQTFATFDDLYRYCYLVASVVGLVCIRIFGYTDPAGREVGRRDGSCLSADEHPARREGGRGARTHLSSARSAA